MDGVVILVAVKLKRQWLWEVYFSIRDTRSTHAHGASCCAVRVSSRRTTVEANMKVSIIYTWLGKTLHNMLFSFAISVLFLPSWPSWLLLYVDFVAFSFSVSLTVGWVQLSIRKTRTLRRTSRAVLRVLLSLHCQEAPIFLFSTAIVCARDAWVSGRERARESKWGHAQIDIPERDGHVRTYARTLRERSLIQSLALMRSATRQPKRHACSYVDNLHPACWYRGVDNFWEVGGA